MCLSGLAVIGFLVFLATLATRFARPTRSCSLWWLSVPGSSQ
jgi:hypothetical protein